MPIYTIDHPYIKKNYPVIYNVFGSDDSNTEPSEVLNGGQPPTSTTGYDKYLEARRQLKMKLENKAQA